MFYDQHNWQIKKRKKLVGMLEILHLETFLHNYYQNGYWSHSLRSTPDRSQDPNTRTSASSQSQFFHNQKMRICNAILQIIPGSIFEPRTTEISNVSPWPLKIARMDQQYSIEPIFFLIQ